MKRQIYAVYLDDPTDPTGDPTEYRVEVRMCDRIVANDAAARNGVQLAGNTFGMVTYWSWAAMTRTGQTALSARDYVAACVDVDPDPDQLVDDAAGIDDRPELDPTMPAAFTDSA